MDSLYVFFQHIEEYIDKYIISHVGNDRIYIAFQFLSYDLIDKELDFDEVYYKTMLDKLTIMLVDECHALCSEGTIQTVEIVQGLCMMKKYSKIEKEIIVTEKQTKTISHLP